jgi:hypothetical protein
MTRETRDRLDDFITVPSDRHFSVRSNRSEPNGDLVSDAISWSSPSSEIYLCCQETQRYERTDFYRPGTNWEFVKHLYVVQDAQCASRPSFVAC